MCATKEETKSKVDRLIQALDRHTNAIERLLIADPGEDSLQRDARSLRSRADALSVVA